MKNLHASVFALKEHSRFIYGVEDFPTNELTPEQQAELNEITSELQVLDPRHTGADLVTGVETAVDTPRKKEIRKALQARMNTAWGDIPTKAQDVMVNLWDRKMEELGYTYNEVEAYFSGLGNVLKDFLIAQVENLDNHLKIAKYRSDMLRGITGEYKNIQYLDGEFMTLDGKLGPDVGVEPMYMALHGDLDAYLMRQIVRVEGAPYAEGRKIEDPLDKSKEIYEPFALNLRTLSSDAAAELIGFEGHRIDLSNLVLTSGKDDSAFYAFWEKGIPYERPDVSRELALYLVNGQENLFFVDGVEGVSMGRKVKVDGLGEIVDVKFGDKVIRIHYDFAKEIMNEFKDPGLVDELQGLDRVPTQNQIIEQLKQGILLNVHYVAGPTLNRVIVIDGEQMTVAAAIRKFINGDGWGVDSKKDQLPMPDPRYPNDRLLSLLRVSEIDNTKANDEDYSKIGYELLESDVERVYLGVTKITPELAHAIVESPAKRIYFPYATEISKAAVDVLATGRCTYYFARTDDNPLYSEIRPLILKAEDSRCGLEPINMDMMVDMFELNDGLPKGVRQVIQVFRKSMQKKELAWEKETDPAKKDKIQKSINSLKKIVDLLMSGDVNDKQRVITLFENKLAAAQAASDAKNIKTYTQLLGLLK